MTTTHPTATPPTPQAQPVQARFSASALLFAAPFRARNDIRFYLGGVHVQPHPDGGVLVAASDGYQLGVAYDPLGQANRPFLAAVQPSLLSAAGKAKARIVTIRNERLTVLDEAEQELGIQAEYFELEHPYVDYGRLLPASVDDLLPGAQGYVQPMLLRRAADTFHRAARREVGPRTASGVTHWTRRGESTTHGMVISRCSALPNCLALTMPLRDRPDHEEQLADLLQTIRIGRPPQADQAPANDAQPEAA